MLRPRPPGMATAAIPTSASTISPVLSFASSSIAAKTPPPTSTTRRDQAGGSRSSAITHQIRASTITAASERTASAPMSPRMSTAATSAIATAAASGKLRRAA